jgi:hypothetical protein
MTSGAVPEFWLYLQQMRMSFGTLTQRRFAGWGGVITGTAADVADTLADLSVRGVERFYLQFHDFGSPDTLARFGADVIRLRATAGPAGT